MYRFSETINKKQKQNPKNQKQTRTVKIIKRFRFQGRITSILSVNMHFFLYQKWLKCAPVDINDPSSETKSV